MRFEFQLIDRLPRLAWCALVSEGSPVVHVLHGPWVETGEQFFVDGIWDGPYDDHRVDRSHLLMGSAGILVEDTVVFAAPCHELESLFLVHRGNRVIVANSLAFVLERAGLELDTGYPRYQLDFWSVLQGPERQVRTIPTRGGPAVALCNRSNVMVDRTLRIAEQPKPRATAWQGFAEYREFLVRSLDRLQTNASAHQRKVRYALLGSVSSGYDSAAATALAAEVGCRHALTFRQGSAYVNGAAIVADSGAEVGRILGLSVREFDKRDFRAADPIIAAETAACGDSYDLQLGAFERDLAQTAFITGFRGDGVWSRLPGERHPLITDGSSLGEFRLRVGFVHVPVPFIGFERRADILAISNSEEMRPWMVGTDYDRPIPRRILEEKGVPRHLFGQTKKGSFRAVQPDDDFNVEVSEFEEFYREHRRAAPLGRRMVVRMRYVLHRLASRMARVAHRFGGPPRLYTMTSLDVAVPGRRTLVVQWGNRVLQARYRIAEDDQSTLTDPQC